MSVLSGRCNTGVERVTALGSRLFRRRPCRRTVNERTGTPFNHLQVSTDIVARRAVVVALQTQPCTTWRRRSPHGASPSRMRPFRAVGVLRPAPDGRAAGQTARQSGSQVACRRNVGEGGRALALPVRAIDANGNLVDSMLSEARAWTRPNASSRAGAGSTPHRR